MKGLVKANFSMSASALSSEWEDEIEHVQSAIERAY
jgi:hypothetical protein